MHPVRGFTKLLSIREGAGVPNTGDSVREINLYGRIE
jgi:hypothetical protein